MEAKILFGSKEESRENLVERHSPYDGRVVSKAPLCNSEDTHQALGIAKEAAKVAKKSSLAQRCAWILDVAKKLEVAKEEMAQTITDEVGKPISFARVEVDRCI